MPTKAPKTCDACGTQRFSKSKYLVADGWSYIIVFGSMVWTCGQCNAYKAQKAREVA
jgi:hypothetical protein